MLPQWESMMTELSTLTLVTSPQESLHALQRAVAQRFNWRIMTGGKEDHLRFIIEKRVRYDFIRGVPTYALYQIMGSFQKTTSGDTALHYAVSGNSSIPFFYASLHISILLVVTFLVGSIVFSPPTAGNWIGILLFGVLLVTILAYGLFAYHNYYQGPLRELNRFMEEFAQQAGIHPDNQLTSFTDDEPR